MNKVDHISHYVIGKEICSGCYGNVMEAYDTKSKSECVIKFNQNENMNEKEANIMVYL